MDTKRFFVYVRSNPRAVALVPTQALTDPDGTFLAISALGADNGNGSGADSNGD
ncbi:hypothetical protein LPJ56_006564, partial [Coemansia sp. RSA 2599]